jgi:hypothetical protein
MTARANAMRCQGNNGIAGKGLDDRRVAHDSVNAFNAALLAKITQIVRDFSVAVHGATFQPRLPDMTKQTPALHCPFALRDCAPGIETARIGVQHFAQPSNRVFLSQIVNQGVPYPDILAKYAAAFFKISRSSITRFSSAFAGRGREEIKEAQKLLEKETLGRPDL